MHKRLSVVLFLSLIIGTGHWHVFRRNSARRPFITPKLPADSNILKPNINAPTELTAANSD